jgi:hypothetical protein
MSSSTDGRQLSPKKIRSTGDSEKVAGETHETDNETKLRSTGDVRKEVPTKED